MIDFATILAGFADAFTPATLLFVLAGIVLGQVVGAIPGLSAPMAIAIAVPFTYAFDPLPAIAFLIGVGKGGTVGGAVPAILINTPGTPDAAATAMDGYPLAQQGKPEKALKMALFSSITGDTMSDIVLITVAAPLAAVALMMGPVEISALMVLALVIIAGLVGDSLPKGMIAAALGLFCASIGLDPEHGTARLQFGIYGLYDGLPLAAVAVGMLAVSELLHQIALGQGASLPAVQLLRSQNPADRRVSWAEYRDAFGTMFRGGVIGTIIGALPGIGSTAAAFISYGMARSASQDPSSFGKGNLKGIAACESANSAVSGANLIPLLTLGIPGNVTAALIIGAFIVQGIQPGPLLFQSQGQLIYGLFGAMVIGNVLNLLVGNFGLRLWARVVRAPGSVIFPVSLLLCVTGVYLSEGGALAVVILLIFGLLGWLMNVTGFPVIAFIIAFILGGQFERSLAQALIVTRGDPMRLLSHPVAIVLLMMSVILLGVLLRSRKKQQRAEA